MIFDSLKLCRRAVLLFLLGCGSGVGAQVTLVPQEGLAQVLGQVHASPEGSQWESDAEVFAAWDRGEFVRLTSHLARGYSTEPVWLAFDVVRQDHSVPNRWVLEVGPSALDRVEAWIRTPQGFRYLGRAGDQRPADQAPMLALKPTFVVDFGDELKATIMVRIQTTSTQVGLVRLISEKVYPSEQAKEGGLLGLIFTVSGVVLILALIRAWVTRESSSLLWGAYIFCTASLWAVLDGLAYQFVDWQDQETINLLVSALTLLSWGFMAAFTTSMFEFRLIRGWIPKAVWGSFTALIALGLPSIVMGWVAIDSVVAVGLVMYLPFVVLGLIYQMAQGRSMSVWHGPWMLLYFAFLIWHVLATRGWIPYSYINFYGWQVAGVTSLISMHWAMIHRARLALQARDLERMRLLAEISNKNQELEDRVAERTRSLASALNDMERAEAEQRQLLSMASHEFRTPAAMIKASLESLAMLKDQTSPMVQQRLSNMALASERMVLLANGLIQQDRLREHSLRPQLKSMDLCDLVQSVASHYPKNSAIEWSCPNTPLRMSADPILLSIALYNLVDNALRHHPEQANTAVRVGLNLRRGDQGLPGEWAVVRVSDAGPGVPDEDKARLFERFESGQTRPDRAPSGLGLSIVARVAQVHGGRVAVSDNSPVGTVFELVLPLEVASV
jgi:two-component system, sensor histidine kinase LadS